MVDSRRRQKDSSPSPAPDTPVTHVDPTLGRQTISDQERQRRLELDFAAWVETPAAKNCLDALKLWYVQSIFGPNATNEELRYREGQRSVIGVIETYAERGRSHGRTGGGDR